MILSGPDRADHSFFEQNTAASPDQVLTTGTGCPDERRITAFGLAGSVNQWLILLAGIPAGAGGIANELSGQTA
jgi:hypothetical protein